MDLNRLTQKSQEALHDGADAAARAGHTEVDGEHLLLALLDQPDGLVPPAADQAGADPAALRARRREPSSTRRPQRDRPGRRARARSSSPSGWPGCSTPPSGRPSGSRTSTSRSSTCCWRWPTRASRDRGRRLLAEHGVTRDAFLGALTAGPRQPAGHLRHPGGRLRGAGEVRPGPGRRRPRRPARPGHRPRRRDPPGDPDPVPQVEEQPGADRRPRRRQDRDRRGPGPADRPRRRARRAAGQDRLRPRHGLAGRRREVPRRVRGAAARRCWPRSRPPRGGSCCSSTSCTPWSAPAPPRARWTPATCSSRCSPAASCT